MDWYLDGRDAAAVGALRREIAAYLSRHAAPGSDIAGSELALSEMITNAVRHAPGPAWVSIDWSGEQPRLEVNDLGPGFELTDVVPDATAIGGRGLYIIAAVAQEVAVAAKRAGGSRVSAVLPVRRAAQEDADPADTVEDALPPPTAARPDGTFGKDPFLTALVVELARCVEADHGPAAAERAVAGVGARVGRRMEEAYRAARRLDERLTPEQMGDLYVRLKAAIDGDFYVLEAGPDRIVLGNRACPFGELVKRAPGLCRMTSSVFGGIAARNTGAASVLLEERIALGDPECRVVVWLGGTKTGQWEAAHEYTRAGA